MSYREHAPLAALAPRLACIWERRGAAPAPLGVSGEAARDERLAIEAVWGSDGARLASGCTSLAGPEDKPHGQRVAYVRDPFGTLIELATPL
jgi:catechol 2,3-dioxygenase-like lactoylglutathione lyase family enzyme